MNTYLNRREKIVLTIIDIINELGFQGYTTKEICRRQQISEGTLYKHYKSKQEMTLALLEYYAHFDKSIIETILMNNLSSQDGLRFYVTRFAEYYENYPAITAIPNSYELLGQEPIVKEKIQDIFFSRTKFLIKLIEQGKDAGEYRSNLNSECLADAIEGMVMIIILKWRMTQYSFPLKARILTTLDMLIEQNNSSLINGGNDENISR